MQPKPGEGWRERDKGGCSLAQGEICWGEPCTLQNFTGQNQCRIASALAARTSLNPTPGLK